MADQVPASVRLTQADYCRIPSDGRRREIIEYRRPPISTALNLTQVRNSV